jgi:hypothetical protein
VRDKKSVRNKKISVSDKHSEGVKNPCHPKSNVFGKAKNELIKKKRKKIRAIIAIRESRAKLAYAMPNEAIIL